MTKSLSIRIAACLATLLMLCGAAAAGIGASARGDASVAAEHADLSGGGDFDAHADGTGDVGVDAGAALDGALDVDTDDITGKIDATVDATGEVTAEHDDVGVWAKVSARIDAALDALKSFTLMLSGHADVSAKVDG